MLKLFIVLCLGIGLVLGGTYSLIASNSASFWTASFTAPAGQHINSFFSYVSGSYLYLSARASGGTWADVIATTLVDIWFIADWTAPSGTYIKGFDSYVSAGTLFLDALISDGSDQTIIFTTNPNVFFSTYNTASDWLKALISSSGGGWVYLDAVTELNQIGVKEVSREHQSDNLSITISPNPSRSDVHISYSLPEPGEATLKIYDANGRLVKSFNLTSTISHLTSTVSWHGTDESGKRVVSGIYFCRLDTPYGTETKRIVIVE